MNVHAIKEGVSYGAYVWNMKWVNFS